MERRRHPPERTRPVTAPPRGAETEIRQTVAEAERATTRSFRDGGGANVANCGYMTADQAKVRGVARSMCEHSLQYAHEHGFRAMQFNFVISTNERAIRLWQHLGFEIVGRLPLAFLHPKLGYTD